jgi:hypothetical protein
MNKNLIRKLDREFDRFPSSKSVTVPYEEIEQSFSNVGFNLPDSYKKFIHLYGGATVGAYPIYGLRSSKDMGEGYDSALVVTNKYDGNPFALDEEGKIWLFDHDLGSIELIASNFEEFITKWCLEKKE